MMVVSTGCYRLYNGLQAHDFMPYLCLDLLQFLQQFVMFFCHFCHDFLLFLHKIKKTHLISFILKNFFSVLFLLSASGECVELWL